MEPIDPKKNGQNFAFPNAPDWHGFYCGLTKRELIAAMCLEGLAKADGAVWENPSRDALVAADHAACAVRRADALLIELAKVQP